jgi:inner membrane protein
MDTFTHIALGAAVGEIMLGKKLGKRAMIIGAAANTFPDIDFLASLWLSPADNVLAHRGFTHSILCMVLLTLLFCWVALKWDKQHAVSPAKWFSFFLLQLGLHLFVDAFNAYGVGWFIPFDDIRISFHTIFVVDPFYSSILILVFILLLLYPVNYKYRNRMAALGLSISALFLIYALINKSIASSEVQNLLRKQKISYNRYFTTPTPFNTWLWFAVAEVDSGYYMGYRSVFDRIDTLPLTFVPRNEYLLEGLQGDHDLQQLKKFSQGYYTVEYRADTLVFNDLRFGQITGWHTPNPRFAFHFHLNFPDDNLLVMQRGRLANWNQQTARSLIKRIKGNQ